VRDDDRDRDDSPGEAERCDHAAHPPAPSRQPVPDPEAGHDERDLLLAERGGDGAERERDDAVLVEEPEREEQERCCQRDRVELVEREPAGCRVEQVRAGEAERGARRPEVLAREPVDGQRAESDRERLDDEQEVRAGPDPPQRREDDEDGIDMSREPRDLVSVEVGHPQRMAVRGRPHRLHHVPHVEATGEERLLAEDGQRREGGDPRGSAREHERRRSREIAPHRSGILAE
jgi:hypothetical protein